MKRVRPDSGHGVARWRKTSIKGKDFLTKMNERYWALAWQTRAKVSQVFYDGP